LNILVTEDDNITNGLYTHHRIIRENMKLSTFTMKKHFAFIRFTVLIILILLPGLSHSQSQGKFSVAGFYELPGSGRDVYNFNVGWRFFKGDISGAEGLDFKDNTWDVISLPHTVSIMPVEASGCINYQGPAWYRKHFKIDENFKGKLLTVYFEAAMGRSQVYVNGKRVLEHLGGYLPFSIDLTSYGVMPGQECIIALKVDNSNDKNYPPGKAQNELDFCYHGGIYRDSWLIVTDKIHISDANKSDRVAAGGVFAHVENLDTKNADVFVNTDIQNDGKKAGSIQVQTILRDPQGKIVKTSKSSAQLPVGSSLVIKQILNVKEPKCWTPETPFLYTLETRIISNGKSIDGGITRIGLRKLEFKGKDGFYLNGKPYDKLIGANRHQDFAYVGNAMPNSQQWRDARKLRDAGCRVIRTAHYPMDPAFMDACDELGLFVIEAIPGWQYFNKDPHFAELSFQDLRNEVRRDRNHACMMMWEPILNETEYPANFSLKTQAICHEEYPYQGVFTAADAESAGIKENYDVLYGYPVEVAKYNKPMFTREFGDYVDDWYAQNAPNRVSRSWGESPQITQAMHLARIYNDMCNTPRQFFGGALWHSFDHQRGYHPDPFWGGIMDAFRQPKYSYYMFKSQANGSSNDSKDETVPMIFITNEMTPFSGSDVVVFTNCDSLRLIRYERDSFTQKAERKIPGMPHPPVVFKNIFGNYDMHQLTYGKKNAHKANFVVEGFMGGKVVCTVKKTPSGRTTKLRLSLDHEGQSLKADGSDFMVIVCEVIDDKGNVHRLAKQNIAFTVEGEGEIIGDASIGANPRAVEFGSAPALIRSTVQPGKITVKAMVQFEGEHTPTSTEITFESVAPDQKLIYQEKPWKSLVFPMNPERVNTQELKNKEKQKQKILEEVEKQQTRFGEKF